MTPIKLKHLLPEFMAIINEAIDVPPAAVSIPHIHSGSDFKPFQSNIDFRSLNNRPSVTDEVSKIVKKFENSQSNPHGGFDKISKKWYPHHSIEGGSKTIAYGHKILSGENFDNGITELEATNLLNKDIAEKTRLAKSKIQNFESLPISAKIAIINSFYRGDIGPKTISLINKNDLLSASKEYLNHSEYRHTSNSGIKKRMELNAEMLAGQV